MHKQSWIEVMTEVAHTQCLHLCRGDRDWMILLTHQHTVASTVGTLANKTIIGLVAHLLNYREDCLAFWLIIPPLLIVPSLACSVTSLSLCPEP